MVDRTSKRARRLSTEEGVDEWEKKSSNAHLTNPAPTASSTRPRRSTVNQPPPSAVIQRSSPEETRQSIHLTVKADPNKLRKATSGTVPKSTARTNVTSRNIVVGKRASRNSRVVREVDSDDEDEDEEEDEPEAMDVDEDEEDEDEDAEGEEDDEADAEGEDEEMEDLPTSLVPPTVVSRREKAPVNPVVNAAGLDSVEAKEISMVDDDDDELSELDSDLEGDEEDVEGEEDEEEETGAQNGDEDEDEDMDSDDGTPGSETPDLSKMTRRQRAKVEEESDGALMALSNEAQKKKHLTAEEHAMRRAEMARRRKNLSEKRNEEEKMDTINRLLKKQPPKRGKRAIHDTNDSGQEDEGEVEKANPLYVRYIQTVNGTRMAVPEEWLDGPSGSVFSGSLAKPSHRPFGGRMVEEVA